MQTKKFLLPTAILIALVLGTPAQAAGTEKPSLARQKQATVRAKDLINGLGGQSAFRASADDFATMRVSIDKDGTEHVRMERSYRGLPVFGGDVVVHSRKGLLRSVNSALKSTTRPTNITPKISKDDAIIEAGTAFGGTINSVPTATLVIYARNTTPTLAYKVQVRGNRGSDEPDANVIYYIDARNGKVLLEDDQIRTASAEGIGRSLLLGEVGITTDSTTTGFQMIDPTRGGGATFDAKDSFLLSGATVFTGTENSWGDGTTANRASAAVDAHFGVSTTWDFYLETFDRNGIFDDGKGVKSYVHYGTNYSNANWDGSSMLYGDGDGVETTPLVSLDIAGHEMTHGVTQATNGLGYYNIKDSGGLNEASSDIMGTLVEFYANNAVDPGDYLIGEEILIDNPDGTRALRVMFKQDIDGASIPCYPIGGFTAADTGRGEKYDPHYTSAVANRFFYLLAEGAVVPAGFAHTASDLVCNGDTGVTGIGRDKAGAIWYRAMDLYFVSTTNYPQARSATLQAATDLYGAGSIEVTAVERAWDAVNVSETSAATKPGKGRKPRLAKAR